MTVSGGRPSEDGHREVDRLADIRHWVVQWISVPNLPDNAIPASPDDVFWLLDLVDELHSAIRSLRPRAVWVNRHTGEKTTITRLESRIERVPDAHSLGFRDEPELAVHHTANVPPGFKGGYGDDAASFVEHWLPASPVVSPEQQEGKVTMHKWVRLRKSEPLRCEHCGVYYAAQWSVVCPGPAPPSPEQEQR